MSAKPTIKREHLKVAQAIISSVEHFKQESINTVGEICSYFSSDPSMVHYFNPNQLIAFQQIKASSSLIDRGLDGKLEYYETPQGHQFCVSKIPEIPFLFMSREVLEYYYDVSN